MTPPSLLRRELLPICWWIGGMVGLALLGGAALRLMNAVWIGLYLGIAGTVLIFGASLWLLGRHDFTWATQNGMPLGMHKRIMLIGTLLVLVHAGIEIKAILAWLAVAALLATVASALSGRYLPVPVPGSGKLHIALLLLFGVLALAHIVTALLFRGWL